MENFALLLIILTFLSLILVGIIVAFSMFADANEKRRRRKKQRDENTAHINIINIRMEELEMRMGMMETKLQNTRK
jgi:MFS superfamily sulfate permease-like transporter